MSASLRKRPNYCALITVRAHRLGARRERPCRCAAEQPDELPPSHGRSPALGNPSSSSSAFSISSRPHSFSPSIRRSVVDQPVLYAALPPPLIPSIDLLLPIGGQHLSCRLLEVVALVSGADCMIRAAKRVITVSARGENVFLQARDVRHVISLRPFIARAACRPVDLEEKARIELQPRVLVTSMPSAIGHKLAVTRYRRPLRQAVLHMAQQYLRDRYLEAIRLHIGWNLHRVEQLLEGRGLLRSGHIAIKERERC